METTMMGSMGGCQNYGPFLSTLNIRCRIITGIQKATITLTTTHVHLSLSIPTHYHSDEGSSSNTQSNILCSLLAICTGMAADGISLVCPE